MELETGRAIGRYIVEARVGEGGMAVVYRVRHADLGAAFALKVLTLTHPRTLERFAAEGRVQAALDHPNIVRVVDVLEVDGHPALVMEYVDGPSLHERIAEGALPLAEAEAIFRGVVAGVAHAHARGFVHRDLKPANVLLAPSPTGVLPKIADFGIVKLVDEPGAGATRTGMTMGTPQYMAPEQVRDAKNVDSRADVFSLGCILYELVCGRPPFQGDDLLTVLTASSKGVYERPENVVPELPTRVVQAIDGSLRVDRNARLPDAEAVLSVLEGRVKLAPPQSEIPTSKLADLPLPPPPAKRRVTTPVMAAAGTGLFLGGAAVGLMAIVGLAIGWYSAPSEPKPPLRMDYPVIADATEGVAPPVEAAPAPAKDGCVGDEGVVIGYARVSPFLLSKGSTWSLTKARPVYADRPRTENDFRTEHPVVCELPRGARVELVEDPVVIRGSGTWVPVVGGHVR